MKSFISRLRKFQEQVSFYNWKIIFDRFYKNQNGKVSDIKYRYVLKRTIYSPHSPAMHWHVPSSPERIDIVGIPPVAVKIPICKV